MFRLAASLLAASPRCQLCLRIWDIGVTVVSASYLLALTWWHLPLRRRVCWSYPGRVERWGHNSSESDRTAPKATFKALLNTPTQRTRVREPIDTYKKFSYLLRRRHLSTRSFQYHSCRHWQTLSCWSYLLRRRHLSTTSFQYHPCRHWQTLSWS